MRIADRVACKQKDCLKGGFKISTDVVLARRSVERLKSGVFVYVSDVSAKSCKIVGRFSRLHRMAVQSHLGFSSVTVSRSYLICITVYSMFRMSDTSG